MRYALVPYIYSATRRTHDESVALCRPLYHDWPEEARAYDRPNQYMFGEDLMIAPVVGPMQETSGGSPVDVWTPPGTWVEWFTGREHQGGAEARLLVPLDEIPIFVRAGAIVCEMPDALRTPERGPDRLIVNVFPGDSGATSLYEDDGRTNGYLGDASARTPMAHRLEDDGSRTITIGPAAGSYTGMPEKRSYEVRLRHAWPVREVTVDGKKIAPAESGAAEGYWYDQRTMTAVISIGERSVREAVAIRTVPAIVGDAAAPMMRGLAGQLALVDDLIAALGSHAPASLTGAQAIRAMVAAEPAGAADAAAAMQASWWTMVDAIRGCDAPGDVREHAIARLLGMSCEVVVEPMAEGEDAVAVRADVAFAPRFDAPKELPVSLRIDADPSWKTVSHEVDPIQRLSVGDHLRARAVLHAEPGLQALQTGHVVAHAIVTDGPNRIEVRADQAFCPSINGWWLVGPFPCAWDEQLDTEFVDVSKIDPSKPVTRPDGTKVEWIKARRTLTPGQKAQSEYRIDLLYSFGEAGIDYAVAYAACDLESDADREVELAIGSDDGVKVWVDGAVVFAKQVQRGYRPKEDRILVRLKKGRNRVVVKITQAEAGWMFGAHVQDLTGRPAPGVRVRLDL